MNLKIVFRVVVKESLTPLVLTFDEGYIRVEFTFLTEPLHECRCMGDKSTVRTV